MQVRKVVTIKIVDAGILAMETAANIHSHNDGDK